MNSNVIGKMVKYTDKYGNVVTAKVIESDGWYLKLDNGGILRALPKYFIK